MPTEEPPGAIPRQQHQQVEQVRRYLEGPQPRRIELLHAARIFREYFHGLRSLHFVGPCVTVFGSARLGESHPEYATARETGRLLAEAGFTVMTGGGPGLMEGANRGARDAGGTSIGCNVVLPIEQAANPYLDRLVTFQHFFIRKVMLVKYSYGFVALAGGFGTFDEVFEAATLIQTRKVQGFPLVLLGREFWQPFIDLMGTQLVDRGLLDRADVDRFLVTDSPAEAVDHVRSTAIGKFGLRYFDRPPRRIRLLGER
jgi:uncharacterized protein (TIGR00730 family)